MLRNIKNSDLADEVLKAWTRLPTAREAHAEAVRRYESSWRDKIRFEPCLQNNRCETDGCPYCERRKMLIEMIEEAREAVLDRRPRKLRGSLLGLMEASDAELADELLKETLGVPTLKEVQRQSKNVYRYARRKGWDVGKECECTGYSRIHCAVCRRSQQLACIVTFLTCCDIDQHWRTITIIPKYGRSELRKQPLSDLRKVVKKVIDTLQEHAPRITGMFVLEPSVNIDREGVQNCQWHIHGIFHRVKKSEYQAIQKAFNWLDGSVRAVHSEVVYDIVGALAYTGKPNYLYREKYVRQNGQIGTDKYPVETRQEALISVALGAKRIGGRVFFINMEEMENRLSTGFNPVFRAE